MVEARVVLSRRIQMIRLYYASAVFVGVVFASGLASAQTAFVEGHIFNKRTGIPLSGAAVHVFENVTMGLLPIELAAGISDANGFYQFEIDQFLGFAANIEVVCGTATGEIRGGSFTLLREGLFRRDIYLEASRRLTRCDPIEPQ
jgi:hypothetical protein